MRFAGTCAAVASGALVTLVIAMQPLSQASGSVEQKGLWSKSFSAGQTPEDCGAFKLDDNGFCLADDPRNGVELGVKFQASQELVITGVRIYRYDTATVTASLWNSDGSRLAVGDFAPSAGTGWQDMSFADPVTIEPGSTYIASYYTPRTKYAFTHEYFAESGLTVGPITAPQAVKGNPNGVHCYDDAQCGSFPVRPYRNTNYWVTPLWQPGPEPTPTATGTATSTSTPTSTGTPTADRQPPRVTSVSPARGARGVRVGKTVKITFSEAIRRASLRSSSVRLVRLDGLKRVATKLRYDAAARRLVINPKSALRPATTYRVVITTSVRDPAGNRLDQVSTKEGPQPAKWTFRTKSVS